MQHKQHSSKAMNLKSKLAILDLVLLCSLDFFVHNSKSTFLLLSLSRSFFSNGKARSSKQKKKLTKEPKNCNFSAQKKLVWDFVFYSKKKKIFWVFANFKISRTKSNFSKKKPFSDEIRKKMQYKLLSFVSKIFFSWTALKRLKLF